LWFKALFECYFFGGGGTLNKIKIPKIQARFKSIIFQPKLLESYRTLMKTLRQMDKVLTKRCANVMKKKDALDVARPTYEGVM